MSKAKPVTIAGKHFYTQGDAVSFFNNQKKELLPEGMMKEGDLFDALKDLYERYCNNSPGYELNGRLITGFSVEYEKLTECLIFLNSGGVTSKTKYIPMNKFFLNILYGIDKIIVKLFPSIFCMGRRIVLKKK